ncbi:hypothetical protein J5N97_028863 [Dioscorea zingiberensis]|uniref:Uncharacterized protein n=1 Tax=Dioscorea zingiberensis TaxID=325984 RepID=A0A9D5BZB4_9LILI|nr:hypothetical protein J5N97_028863 [Dioscorea zingiberensis]
MPHHLLPLFIAESPEKEARPPKEVDIHHIITIYAIFSRDRRGKSTLCPVSFHRQRRCRRRKKNAQLQGNQYSYYIINICIHFQERERMEAPSVLHRFAAEAPSPHRRHRTGLSLPEKIYIYI